MNKVEHKFYAKFERVEPGVRRLAPGVHALRVGKGWVVIHEGCNRQWRTASPHGGYFFGSYAVVAEWAEKYGHRYPSLGAAYEAEVEGYG